MRAGLQNRPGRTDEGLVMKAPAQPLSRGQRIWMAIALAGLALTWSAPATLAWISR